ncbi:MAG: hypothetical protein AAF443_08435 [Chlamydiota bacterium]
MIYEPISIDVGELARSPSFGSFESPMPGLCEKLFPQLYQTITIAALSFGFLTLKNINSRLVSPMW